jgi:uncharacterized protein YfeS
MPENFIEENKFLKKQLKLNHRFAKLLYDRLKETIYIPQEEKEAEEALDKSMQKLIEEYNKIVGPENE